MKRLAYGLGCLLILGVLIADVWVHFWNYKECRKHGLSKVYCATALR